MSEAHATRTILIAGAGIGGLAAALALARRDYATRILERRSRPDEGAGIQLGPNATRALDEIGALTPVSRHASRPRAIQVYRGATEELLAEGPLGGWIAARHQAPYLTLHRADLHATLLECARAEPLISFREPFEAVTVAQDGELVSVTGASGEAETGAALVVSDGLWSKLRQTVTRGKPTFSGKVAARAVVDVQAARWLPETRDVGLWLAPGAHVVHYPVRGGRSLAAVVVFSGEEGDASWDNDSNLREMGKATAAFALPMKRFLAGAEQWRQWPLYAPRPFRRWVDRRIALLGDAAHPILPYLAQGGALALEDALTLADCVGEPGRDIPAAFAAYQKKRRPRAARVQAASRSNGRIYHMSGARAWARDMALRVTPPERLMARYDWLYGWRP